MKIKTQERISLIVFAILAIVIIFSVFASNNQLHEIQKKQQIIDTIEQSSFELYYLENDYLVHGGTITVDRWNAKYAVLTGQLSELTLTDPSEQVILNDMFARTKELNTHFSNLIAVMGDKQGKEPIGASQELKEFYASTLAVQTQTLMSRSTELSQRVKAEALAVEQRTFLIISLSIVALMLFVLLNFLVINRSVLKSISALQTGAERIGSGDLETKIETTGNDELGFLSLTFNEMSSSLRNARTLLLNSNVELEEEIAERKRAEDALHLFKDLVEHSSDAIGMLTPEGKHYYQNEAFDRLFGDIGDYPPETLYVDKAIGKQVFDTIMGGGSWQGEVKLFKVDRTILDIFQRAYAIQDLDGHVIGLVGLYTDITERKRAEETLRLSEVTFRTLIEASPDAIVFSDLEGTVLMHNRMAEILVDNNDGNLETGTKIQTFFPQEELGRLAKNTQKVLEQGSIHNIEYTLIRKDGTHVLVELNASLVKDPGGGQPRFVTVLRDITKRKRVEDTLQKSEEKFRSLVEHALEGILILDLQGTILFANNATARTLEVDDCTGLIGRNVMEFIAPESREDVVRDFSNVSQGHDAYLAQYNAISAKGSKFYVESIGKIISYGGKPADLISIRDITERKQAEDKIQHALAEKEVLLREIHHRVKNNLAGIISLINLQTSSLTDPIQIYLFKDLETRIRSMALVHESLYQTKDIAHIRLATYTENLTRYLFQVYETGTSVRCRIEMGDITMPIETATPCGLVMTEIITNSLKYAFPKTFDCEEIRKEPCTITITMHRKDSDYLLTVADNGIGIPEEIGVNTKTSLGLYLIGFIVKHQLQGSTEVSTGNGTAYTIRFPEPESKERPTNE